MANLQQLLEQKAAIERQIAEARQNEVKDAIARARAIIDQFGLTAADLFGGGKRGRKAGGGGGGKVAPKYRDPATGATWTGRGRTPKWMEGKNKDAFLIK